MTTYEHFHQDHNVFTLYVSHANRDSAVNQVVAALSGGCFCPFQLVIHDVEAEPELVHEENIDHTPTLVREWPSPRRVLCADLSECDTVREFFHSS